MLPELETRKFRSASPALSRGGLALLCILSACARDDDGLRDFRAALASAAGVAPRLSVAREFRPCTERVSNAGTITVADCPAPRRRRPRRFPPLRATADDPGSLHLLALVDLVAPDPRGKALDRSITSLRRTAELSGDSAPVLADLAAALIVRAERTQAPRDLLEAYELADRAVERDPRHPAALYNRALAIDRFGLVDETGVGWQSFLAVDSTSGWAAEARRRIRLARELPAPLRPPRPGAPLSAYAAYAAGEPQGARELGMDSLLAQWGAAAAAGDTPRADAALQRAEALGTALERRPGGDRSLADAVRAIRRLSANRAATDLLARAHHDYGSAQSLYDSAAFERALPLLVTVEANAAASPALQGWARVYRGTTLVHLGHGEEGLAMLERSAESADSARYPALAARALWSSSNTRGRAERWEGSLADARTSARLFERAGERENEGAVVSVGSDARFVLGEPDSGYAAVHRALDRLRPVRGSQRLHSLLAALADVVAQDGLLRAAVRIADEDVRTGTRHGLLSTVEARLRRARFLASRGEVQRAALDVSVARPLVPKIRAPRMRAWMAADLHEAEAASTFRDDPQRRTRALDSAAVFFAPLPFRLVPELVGAAEARIAAGDPADAAKRLETVMRLLEQRRAAIGMEPRRAAVFDAARQVVDQLVMLKLRQGRVAEALVYVDRARASLAATGAAVPARPAGPRTRPGEVAVEYALVGDTLLAWTVAERRVSVARVGVGARQLATTVERLEAKLEAGAGEAEVKPALSQLYEWLIRPLEAGLGGAQTPLVLVADGVLAAVPFAALHDARRGRYLMQDHPLRWAVSLSEAARPPAAATAGVALFVADPAFDPREHPLLDRLSEARTEVSAAAAEYPAATLLVGRQASRAALAEALPRARIAHFAGHAVFDDARPERSYLVLAPSPGDRSGRLTAAELARMDLRGVRLVVLSACRTMRTGPSRAAGYSGLSGALLAAGAAGTIGATWNVNDRATGALVAAFHRAYGRVPNGPGALREAQATLAASRDPALRTPAAWAGFRYAGN
jgi:CHAT domain-containing protein